MTKTDKERYAFLLYVAGETFESIADSVGMSERTMRNWADKLEWKKRRALHNVTRPELVNKILGLIAKILEGCEDGTPNPKITDQLIKAASSIEKLDKKTSIVAYVEVFVKFGKWIRKRSAQDSSIDLDFLKKVSELQNDFMINGVH